MIICKVFFSLSTSLSLSDADASLIGGLFFFFDLTMIPV